MMDVDARRAPGARVLLAVGEDNAPAIKESLEAAGHIVFTADDSDDVLRRVRRDDPEVAVLDAALEPLNGYQVCERVKTHESTRGIPVILLVSAAGDEERVRGMEVGVEDFLAYPVNPSELLARVQSLVRVKRL